MYQLCLCTKLFTIFSSKTKALREYWPKSPSTVAVGTSTNTALLVPYTANIVNISVFHALSIGSVPVATVLLCMKRDVLDVQVEDLKSLLVTIIAKLI